MFILFLELLWNIPTGKLGLSQSTASKHMSRHVLADKKVDKETKPETPTHFLQDEVNTFPL